MPRNDDDLYSSDADVVDPFVERADDDESGCVLALSCLQYEQAGRTRKSRRFGNERW